MSIEKLEEFARDGQKNTDELILTDGFPRPKFPARQWFNWLFNTITKKINEIIDLDPIARSEIVDNLTTNDADKVASAAQVKILNDDKANKTTTLTAGNGLSGGGTLEINRTLTLGTPSKITGSTTNSVTATSHTHEIDNASTSVAGVVKLNNTLTSTSTTEALTGAQGKVLNDQAYAINQTRTSVKASRALNTTYYHTGGKPLTISVACFTSMTGAAIVVSIDDVWRYYGSSAVNNSTWISVTAVIQPGERYSVDVTGGTAVIQQWDEM